MASLAQQTAAAQDPTLVPTIRAALVASAVTIYQESPGTVGHKQRAALAILVAATPDLYVSQFAALCASQNLDKSATDNTLLTAVAGVWNLVAGV